MCAQHGVGRNTRPLRYDALAECLTEVGQMAAILGADVSMPRIGTGLAGGDWGRIGPLVEQLAAVVPVTVYDLPAR